MWRVKLVLPLQNNKVIFGIFFCLLPLYISVFSYVNHGIWPCLFFGLWLSMLLARNKAWYQTFNLPRKVLVKHIIVAFGTVSCLFIVIFGLIFYLGRAKLLPIFCFLSFYILGMIILGFYYRNYCSTKDESSETIDDNAARYESKRWLGIFPGDSSITKPQAALFLDIYKTTYLMTFLAIVGGILISWYCSRYGGSFDIAGNSILSGLVGGSAAVLFLDPLVDLGVWISFGFTRVAYARAMAIKMLYFLIPIMVFFLVIGINVLWQENYIAFLRYLGVGFAIGLLFAVIAICVHLTSGKKRIVWFPIILAGVVGLSVIANLKYQIGWWMIGTFIMGIGVLWLLIYFWFGPFIAKRLRIEQKRYLSDI